MSTAPGPSRDDPLGGSRRLIRWAARRLAAPELASDVEELFQKMLTERGPAYARRWYRRQARAALMRALSSRRHGHDRPRASPARTEMVLRTAHLALRRTKHAPGRAASFGLVVGIGIAAAAFMGEVRTGMMSPDLGLGADVSLVVWQAADGPPRRTVPLTGQESWLHDAPSSLDALKAFWPVSRTVATPGGLLRTGGQRVQTGFLSAMGVQLHRGRDLERPGEAVVSHTIWLTHWSGDRDVLGSTVEIGGVPVAIVGIAPPDFDGPLCCVPPSFWVVDEPGGPPTEALIAVVGPHDRAAVAAWLTDAATDALPEEARADLEYAEAAPYGGETGIIGMMISVLAALAALAWIGTLLSGANLVLADTLDRAGELRLRRALGSHRGHAILRTICETAWLALFAAALALAATWAMVTVAPWMLPIIGSTSAVEVVVGRATAAIMALTVIAASFACSLPAAVVGLRIMAESRIDRGPPRSRLSTLGLSAQIALASLILVVTGMFVQTIRDLDGDFVGFRNGGVGVHFVSQTVDTDATTAATLLERVERETQVRDAALTLRLPVYGARRDSIGLPGGEKRLAAIETVTPGFFDVIGSRLVAGRSSEHPSEIVVSEDLARVIAGEPRSAIDGLMTYQDTLSLRIVGIVEQATWGSGEIRPTVYRGFGSTPISSAVILIRDRAGDGSSFSGLLRAMGPLGFALQPFETLEGLLVRSRVLTVLLTRIAVFFAALCVLVALAGVHAHFHRWVKARRKALAIRRALGAPRTNLSGELVGAAVRVTLPALAVGCGAGWFAGRLLESLLPGMPMVRPGLFLVVGLLVAGSNLAALATPLARIGRADPRALLRVE